MFLFYDSLGWIFVVKYVRVFHLESAVNVYFVYFSTFFFVHLTRFTCCHVINQVGDSPHLPFSIFHAHVCVFLCFCEITAGSCV